MNWLAVCLFGAAVILCLPIIFVLRSDVPYVAGKHLVWKCFLFGHCFVPNERGGYCTRKGCPFYKDY